ncbi:hypothetical protein D3C71_1706300 [compost metagenome]
MAALEAVRAVNHARRRGVVAAVVVTGVAITLAVAVAVMAAVIAPVTTVVVAVMAVATSAIMAAASIIPALATPVIVAVASSEGRSSRAKGQQGGHRGDNKSVHLHGWPSQVWVTVSIMLTRYERIPAGNVSGSFPFTNQQARRSQPALPGLRL